jgi:cysteine desulfurase
MGLGPEIASGTIRISLGLETTKDDVAAFVGAWQSIAGEPALAA